jgi:hypothetical protein
VVDKVGNKLENDVEGEDVGVVEVTSTVVGMVVAAG